MDFFFPSESVDNAELGGVHTKLVTRVYFASGELSEERNFGFEKWGVSLARAAISGRVLSFPSNL